MKLEQSFEVTAPVERVWRALIDVEHFAPLLPGAAVTGRNEDGSYNGTFTVKIGPTTAAYNGKLELQQIDEAARTATIHAHGADRRGQGGATATIVSTISPTAGGTRVQVATEYHITGRLARFGRGGMIQDISERLLRQFAGRLQESLQDGAGAVAGAEAGSAPPVPAGEGDADSEPATPGESLAAAAEMGPLTGESALPAGDAPETIATTGPDAPALPAGGPSVPALPAGGPAAAELPAGGPPAAELPAGEPPAPQPPASGPPTAQPPASPAAPRRQPEPVKPISLVSSVLLDRAKRNPAVTFVVGLLLALVLVVRRRRRSAR
jgi:carbon monoxide dehydrogenase subunit G